MMRSWNQKKLPHDGDLQPFGVYASFGSFFYNVILFILLEITFPVATALITSAFVTPTVITSATALAFTVETFIVGTAIIILPAATISTFYTDRCH